MRIGALNLMAFGPFTDKTLDFSRGAGDFHLVYGPNEAGKSSALRALRALLYGIDERSPDSFVHPYPKMRIGGTLFSKAGERLSVIRRKGRGSTLRAADDQTVVAEADLAAFLSNVDADLFATMFGIGYEDLVAGGREIVAGGGDLGQLIFSAGSGIVHLKAVREALNAEAEALFKPSGKNPAINAALARLRETDKRLRETLLPGTRWAELDAEYRAALSRREALEKEMARNEAARSHLARIQSALPHIARRRELLDELKSYAHVVRLPEKFSETRREHTAALDAARNEADRAGRAIAGIEKEMAGLTPVDAILDNADLIEKLHQQLGSQQKAAADRVKLDTRRSTLLGEAREILRGLSDDLDLADADKLRLKKEQTAAIRRLSTEYEQIAARLESAREALPGLSDAIERLEARRGELPEPRDKSVPEKMEALRTALAEAGDYGPLEKSNSRRLSDFEAQGRVLENRLERLGLSHLDSAGLEALPIPTLETIHLYEDRFDAAERRIAETAKERGQTIEEIRRSETRLQARQMAQAVPSEADLEAVRDRRDQGWALIRMQLEGGSPDDAAISDYQALSPQAESLASAFEQHMNAADEISDRLRREADRVADHARLESELTSARNRKQELDAAEEKAEAERAALSEEWSACWKTAGISASTPREMDRWVRDLLDLKEALAEHEENLRDARQTARTIAEHRLILAECLAGLGQEQPGGDTEQAGVAPLSRLIHRGQQLLESEKTLAGRIEQIDAELSEKKKELSAARARQAAAEADLAGWRTRWEAAVTPLGLSAESLPAEAAEVLDEVRSLFDKLKEADVLEKRIQGIDQDAENFSREVVNLAETAAPNLSDRPPRDLALKLHQLLTQSREARTRYKELAKQLSTERENLDAARKETDRIEARLIRMCEEAGCETVQDLPAAEEHSRRRRELEAELKSVEERILAVSAGATVEEFVAAAAEVDADAIEPELQRLDEAIEALSAEKNTLAETIGRLQSELDRMDGSDAAAALAQERQQILGRMEPDARRYARARLAIHILDRAVERFRDKNQGPMLSRASELFAAITCGTFDGVRAEFEESGRPVIAGVRGGGREPVHVSGMSEGTADQLYLSLRLAGLETAIEKAEPMPFIVDDILIKFDNERAVAALKALAELSRRTQVIFFTHHHHLAALAEHHLAADAPVFHQL